MALMDVFTHFSIIRRERRGIRPEEIKMRYAITLQELSVTSTLEFIYNLLKNFIRNRMILSVDFIILFFQFFPINRRI